MPQPWDQFLPGFALAIFRLGAMFMAVPLLGPVQVPRRMKLVLAAAMTLAMGPVIGPVTLPQDPFALAVGIGGELVFGVALGASVSLVFVAVHWAGQIIGQQMGLDLGEVFDPQFGDGSSLIGRTYVLLALAVFFAVRGHHGLIGGVAGSFEAVPLLAAGTGVNIVNLLVSLLTAATGLALQLAVPMLVSVLVVDLLLALLGRTMPQLNVLSAGLSLRVGLGLVVLIAGLALSSEIIRQALLEGVQKMNLAWKRGL